MSSWFNSWQDFTAKASEVAKSAAEKTVEAAKVAADKSKAAASTVHKKVNDFVEEQKKEYNEVEEESDLQRRRRLNKERMMQSGHCPWFIDRTDNDVDSDELEDELRLNILKLCENESNFLVKAPSSSSVFGFKLECALPYAQKALAEDPILPQIRFRAVPKKLSEEQFWRNYFYRVNVIRESLGVAKLNFSEPPRKVQATEKTAPEKEAKSRSKSNSNSKSVQSNADSKPKSKMQQAKKSESKQVGGGNDETKKSVEAETKQSEVRVEAEVNADDDVDVDSLLAGEEEDEMSIHSMTDEERKKKKRELGITDDAEDEDVEDLLAEVNDMNTEDVEEMSDAELAAELENI